MKKKIALIEDDKILSDRLCSSLKDAGFEVLQAFDGEDGLKLVQTELPSLVLLDILLPRLDGLSIARKLRDDATTKRIPIMILTAVEQMKSVSEALESGVYDYIAKSDFDPDSIVAKVKAKLGDAK